MANFGIGTRAATADALKTARAQFPITENLAYFDIANMNPAPLCVTERLAAYFLNIQQRGGDKSAWSREVEATRSKAARLLGCEAGELAFCKNTSEGLNIAANAIDWRPGDNVVVPDREHPNNVFPWLNLRQRGVEVRLVPETGDWIDAALLAPFVDARTRAVAVADVSFHPGQRNDLAGIAALCRDKGAYLVVDGVQAVGLLDVDLRALGIDMWAVSAHKGLLSPHGVGLFYCRREIIPALFPAYVARASMVPRAGDDHGLVRETDAVLRDDARRFEIGNFNFPGVVALGAALDLVLEIGIGAIESHVLALGEYLTEQLAQRQIERLGPRDPRRRSSICAFNLAGEGWVEYFAEKGIVVSGRLGSIRVSLGLYNTFEEIDRFIAAIDERIKR
jgi:selenocysteine lyase/cysteine desulfurase